MSNLHADTVAYVRDTMLEQREPPLSTVGILGWGKKNLFTGPFNTIVTILCTVFVAYVLWMLLPWFISPTWQAASLYECQGILRELGRDGGHFGGACWGVIRDRWVQLLAGFYPSDLYWRPLLALALLGVAIAPVLFTRLPRKLVWFTAVYPVVFPWLLWGGAVWVPLLVIAGVMLSVFVYKLVGRFSSPLFGIIAGVLFAVFWFTWATGAISTTIDRVVGSARIESVLAETDAQIAELTAESVALEAEIDATEARILEIISSVSEPEGAGDGAYLDAIQRAAPDRAILADLRDELFVVGGELGRLRALKRQIDDLPAQISMLPDLEEEAIELRQALPDSVKDVHSEVAMDTLQAQILQGDIDVPTEDLNALKKTLAAEKNVADTERAIRSTYNDVARIGLEPVSSRRFGGMLVSITIGVVAIACSLPLGIVLALGRQSDLLIVKSLCVGFIELMRGVPLITLLFVASTLLNVFLPPGTNFDIILRVIIMATLFASAYMAEVIRGGLAALSKGQYEGADSLGLNYWQAQRLIIMPQALKISIPGIVSTFIGLFKDTTLVSVIGILDPLGLSTSIRSDQAWNGVVWELYGFIALLFFICCFSMSRYSMYLERKLQTGHR